MRSYEWCYAQRKIVLVNEPSSGGGMAELGQALKDNKHHSVVFLDLTRSAIDDKGIQSLSEAFGAFPHGLITLDLTECGLNDKGLALYASFLPSPVYFFFAITFFVCLCVCGCVSFLTGVCMCVCLYV